MTHQVRAVIQQCAGNFLPCVFSVCSCLNLYYRTWGYRWQLPTCKPRRKVYLKGYSNKEGLDSFFSMLPNAHVRLRPFLTSSAGTPKCGEEGTRAAHSQGCRTFALKSGGQGQEISGEEAKSCFPNMIPDNRQQPAPWEIQSLPVKKVSVRRGDSWETEEPSVRKLADTLPRRTSCMSPRGS